METIIFYVTDKKNGVKAVQDLVDDIKANKDAEHKLFFKFLMADTYHISMGTTDDKGNRHLIGEHEVIFIPQTRLGKLDATFNENKKILYMKNCMTICGDGKKPKAMRALLIDWLLEKKKEIKL